jgi:hypothetical protein
LSASIQAGGHARVLEHPVRHRAVAGRRVIVERQLPTLMGQIIECPFLLRYPDLPLDDRLADPLPGRLRRVRSLGVALVDHPAERTRGLDRRAVASAR